MDSNDNVMTIRMSPFTIKKKDPKKHRRLNKFTNRRVMYIMMIKAGGLTNLTEPKMCHSLKPPLEIRVWTPEVRPPGTLTTEALEDGYVNPKAK